MDIDQMSKLRKYATERSAREPKFEGAYEEEMAILGAARDLIQKEKESTAIEELH